MAKTKSKTAASNMDMIYFLKLVMYLILGSIWVKVTDGQTTQFPIPVGLFGGLFIALHEKNQTDRKIGLAVLLVAMLIGFWAPIGIYIVK